MTADRAIGAPLPSVSVNWAPPPDGTTALIINLPGAGAIAVGIALAAIGYQPVPLYNACNGPNAIVLMDDILDGLAIATPLLQQLSLSEHAPPAFLLDANRMCDTAIAQPGDFDNRWLVFAQDFPSAKLLRSKGIQRVVLRQNQRKLDLDLIQVLHPWQKAGISLFWQDPLNPASLMPLVVHHPSWLQLLWYRATQLRSLKRNSAGGFGSVIPESIDRGGG